MISRADSCIFKCGDLNICQCTTMIMKNLYLLDELLLVFDFLFDDISEGVSFGMAVGYAKPLNSVPPIDHLTQR
ncbi:unnamed protein product [Prunus armeniaca]